MRSLKIGAVVLLLALTGCATLTPAGYQQHMDRIVGYSTDQLRQEWGEPDLIQPLSDGSEMWVYRQHYVQQTDGYVSDLPVGSYTEEYTDRKGRTHTRIITPTQRVYTPSSTTESRCETRFVIGPDRIVRTVRFNGDACLAQEAEPSSAK